MRTKRYATPHDPRRKNGPVVVVRRPDPGLWREALVLADGDPSRLTVDPATGAITVHNQPPQRR